MADQRGRQQPAHLIRRYRNRTSYQEYSTAFTSDYTNNDITLTPAFFSSLTDGAKVTLTFHFWSGATATYYVTKNGTAVTGTTS